MTVHAAGGVVWRRSEGGGVEILVVHRPRYDDWSLPKGKLARGETDVEAALREVEEETGLRCVVGAPLPSVSYRDRLDRPKTVRFWAMTPVSGEFKPSEEVDVLRWVAVEDAPALLTYERDRPVVAALSGAIR